MANRLSYKIAATDPAEQTRREAYQELDALVVSLHEHGVLRLLRDVSGSLSAVSLIAARELDHAEGHAALANLYVLARLLGRLPSNDFRRAANAMGDGFTAMSRRPEQDDEAPGLTGAYALLQDEELWRALGPILEGVKAFARELRGEAQDLRRQSAGKEQ